MVVRGGGAVSYERGTPAPDVRSVRRETCFFKGAMESYLTKSQGGGGGRVVQCKESGAGGGGNIKQSGKGEEEGCARHKELISDYE